MDEEVMTRSSIEAPSFARFGATAVMAEISGEDDFPLDDFEFTFTSMKSEFNDAAETDAYKIFSYDWIVPVSPRLNGDLVNGGLKRPEEEKMEGGIGHLAMVFEKHGHRSGLKSSEVEELDKADSVSKSNSTGTMALESRRLRLRDIVFGRSRSEGNKVLLVPASGKKKMEMSCFSLFRSSYKSASKEAEKKEKRGGGNRGVGKELDIASAHRIYYCRGIAGGTQMARGSSRRSFLPYRLELLAGGLFCNAAVWLAVK